MKNKLVLVSVDSLQSGDLKAFLNLPYMASVASEISVVKNVREIYPTLTYPIHNTMITGVYPATHGITHNQRLSIQPENPDFNIMGSNWYWEKSNLKVPTLVDAVIEAGGTAATVLWPTTAGEKRGFNVPEIWPEAGEDPRELMERTASPAVLDAYYQRFMSRYDWRSPIDFAEYSIDIAADILQNHKPDLLLCHFAHLDYFRHDYGVYAKEAAYALRMMDVAIGRLMKAAKDAGTWEQTNFVILGDHGQINIRQIFNLNNLLQKYGFIRCGDNGKITDYDAYSFSAGFSTQIMLRNPDDAEIKKRLHQILLDMQAEFPEYIDRVYTADEAMKEEQLMGDFNFVLEGTEGTLFANDLHEKLIIPYGTPEYKMYRATHGHHPSKGEKPPFIAFGPGICPGNHIDHGTMLDVCPTLAALVGVDMPQMVGNPFPILR